MKKLIRIQKDTLFVTLIILSVLIFLIPLFHTGIYNNHDSEGHIARFAAYLQAFKDGQFPPRWAGNLNYGYGTAAFIFYYPLPGYLASALHLLNISWETIFKLMIGAAAICAPLSFYFWGRTLFRKEVAFIGAILYAFAPYHFLDLYVRGDIAEMIAFVFAPLVFLCLEKYILTSHSHVGKNPASKKNTFLIFGGIAYALLIFSHNGVSLMFSPVFLLYAALRSKNKKIFFQSISILILGLLLAAFFWVPALYEGKYVNAKLFIGDMFKDNFPNPLALIYSVWGYGPDVNKPGGLSPQIGIINAGLALIGIGIFFKQKKKDYLLALWAIVFISAAFITLSMSAPLWKSLSILRLYEFPWRFTGLSSFAAVVLACFVLQNIKNPKVLTVFVFIIILTAIPFARVNGYTTKSDSFYDHFPKTTSYHGETIPVWTAGQPGDFAKSQLELIGGQATITNLQKKSQQHTFTINARTQSQILDNTDYFPGWRVYIDRTQTPIQFQDMNHRGRITFYVPKGIHQVTVLFTETVDRKIADIISLLSWGLVLSVLAQIIISRKSPLKKNTLL